MKIKNDTIYIFFKKIIDIIVSSLMLSILSPILILIVVSIAFTSKGKVIFKQQRIGKNGKPFNLYKFRTLSLNTPQYAPKPKEDDPKINKVGKLLRKSGLDELLQLINVLKGDMSLVGPRPEMPFIVENYSEVQKERLKVKPGITGLWQLSNKVKEPIRSNLEYDLSYIRNQSLLLDLKILFRTFVMFFKILIIALKDFLR